MGRQRSRRRAAAAGPSGKTGWEALDKWVGSGAAAAPAAAGPSGKTGWEALDKWVGSGAAAAPEAPTTGAAPAAPPAAQAAPAAAATATAEKPAPSGGFWGSLKRFLAGK